MPARCLALLTLLAPPPVADGCDDCAVLVGPVMNLDPNLMLTVEETRPGNCSALDCGAQRACRVTVKITNTTTGFIVADLISTGGAVPSPNLSDWNTEGFANLSAGEHFIENPLTRCGSIKNLAATSDQTLPDSATVTFTCSPCDREQS